jgi:hypothetical protein
MTKAAKKSKGRAAGGRRGEKKLPRGYKECGNCRRLLHIHKYVCDDCGHKHDMKKKKVDVLKHLHKVTPKLLRSLIELDDFNELPQPALPRPFSHFTFPSQDAKAPSDFKRRRSSKGKTEPALSWHTSTDRQLSYAETHGQLTCLCPLFDGVFVA